MHKSVIHVELKGFQEYKKGGAKVGLQFFVWKTIQ